MFDDIPEDLRPINKPVRVWPKLQSDTSFKLNKVTAVLDSLDKAGWPSEILADALKQIANIVRGE